MAKILRLFERGKDSRKSSFENDKSKASRLILGELKHCECSHRRLFELVLPENDSKSAVYFPPLAPSVPQEKLRKESQTFPQWKVQKDFQRLSFKQRKRWKQKKMYFLPIGPFPEFVLEPISGLNLSLFELLCKFVSIFYLGFDVMLKDAVNLDELHCKTRIHGGTRERQILVGDVLSYLHHSLPKDGFAIIGITWEDMYPGDEWNFVLGEGSSIDGCAAMSFGHYEPEESQRIYNRSKDNPEENRKYSRTSDQQDTEGQNQSCAGGNAPCEKSSNRMNGNTVINCEIHSRTSDQNLVERNESSLRDVACEESSIGSNDQSIRSIEIHSRTKDQEFAEGSCSQSCIGASQCEESLTKINENNVPEAIINDSITGQVRVELGHSVNMSSSNGSGMSTINNYESVRKGKINKIDAFQIWKFFRVISHELGHVFGLSHCLYFSCAMNESSTVQEAINQPLFMCPVCLKKIQAAVGFDITERYSKLGEFLGMVYESLVVDQGKGCASNSRKETSMKYIQDCSEIERFSSAVSWIKSVLSYLETDDETE